MKVADLKEALGVKQTVIQMALSQLSVSADARQINVEDDDPILLDEVAESLLAKFLNIPLTYLSRCPEDLVAHQFNYWLNFHSASDAMLTLDEDGALVDAYAPERRVIRFSQVGEVIADSFKATDEIATLEADRDSLLVDIKTEWEVVVAGDGGDLRPVEDRTFAGVRLRMKKDLGKGKPVIEPILVREYLGGITVLAEQGEEISLRGKDIDDVLAEIGSALRNARKAAMDALTPLRETAEAKIEGSVAKTLRTLGQEHKLKNGVIDALLNQAHYIDEERDPTVYDLVVVLADVAGGSVPKGTRDTLQALSGHLVAEPEEMDRRCDKCSHLLVG